MKKKLRSEGGKVVGGEEGEVDCEVRLMGSAETRQRRGREWREEGELVCLRAAGGSFGTAGAVSHSHFKRTRSFPRCTPVRSGWSVVAGVCMAHASRILLHSRAAIPLA